MHSEYRTVYCVWILYLSFYECDSQFITLCEIPEKKLPCVLQCRTKDFKHPVTFSHPIGKDVGSCISAHDCGSFYYHYNLSQKIYINDHLTELRIAGIDRDRDQGRWICHYGNLQSQMANLIVHTKPLDVDIMVNDGSVSNGSIEIKCLCYCVYPIESASIKIIIGNKLRRFTRQTKPMIQSGSSEYGCEKNEIVVIGSTSIYRKNLKGDCIDINCVCKESVLNYTQIRNKSHILQGIPPDAPYDFRLQIAREDSLTVEWEKGYNGELIQSFVILYKSVKENDTYKQISIKEEQGRSRYNTTLPELTPNSTYILWIYSSNSKGKSKHIGPFHFNTSEVSIGTTGYEKILIPICIIAAVTIPIVIIVICVYKKWKEKRQGSSEKTEKQFEERVTADGSSESTELKKLIKSRETVSKLKFRSFETECGEPYITGDILKKVPRYINEMYEFSPAARNIIDYSKKGIEKIISPRIFVHTRGFISAWSIMEKHNVLIYKGAGKDGRYTHAIQIMQKLEDEFGYYPLLLDDITKWDEVVNLNFKMIVLVQHIMFEKNLNAMTRKMTGCVENGNTKIIIICKKTESQKLSNMARIYPLFNEKHHIDLSSNLLKLTKNEKREIFLKHCQVNDIKICSDIQHENYEQPNVRISKETVEKIIESDPAMGFPQSCANFCKNRQNTRMGVDFFLQSPKRFRKS